MRIGFLLPASFAGGNPFNGIREQAIAQADALANLGHDVIRMNPWSKLQLTELDILQFFVGGPAMLGLQKNLTGRDCRAVFAPIIDSTMDNARYRVASLLGNLHPRFLTVPGEFSRQARFSSATIVRSAFERERVIKGLGASPERVHVVLNGCNPAGTVDPEPARRHFELRDDFALHVSRYTNASKNVEALIDAIGPTGRTLLIAGTEQPGATLDRIRTAAARYRNVRMIGRVDDTMRDSLYAACRVFCLPSVREGTGLVALEAAAHGAAVVITHNGGPPDYFQGFAEYVHGSGAAEIRQAVNRAWDKGRDPALQAHVTDNLSWTMSAKALERVYDGLLA